MVDRCFGFDRSVVDVTGFCWVECDRVFICLIII